MSALSKGGHGAAGLGVILALVSPGCGSSGFRPGAADLAMAAMVDPGQPVIVTVAGAATGTFPGVLHVRWGAASMQTRFTIVNGKDPGLGIATFEMESTLVGQPETRHYGEREAQIRASLTLLNGGALQSSIDSMNTLDLSAIEPGIAQPDGSLIYHVTGMAAGAAASSTTPDVVHFSATF